MPTPINADALARLVEPGTTVFVPGSSGAPLDFMEDLARHPERTRGLQLFTSYVPGINPLELEAFDPSARVSGLFMQPALRGAQRDGRYRALPVTYAGFVRHLLDHVDLDLTVVQVGPPDSNGRCSLGPAVEFMPTALQKSRRVLGLVNHRMPRVPGAVSIPYARLDHVCEVERALPEYRVDSDTVSDAIAAHIATLVDDDSVLQVGLGRVPMALSRLLCDRRKLRLHSGMLSDGFRTLSEAGALDPDFPHTSCVLVGSAGFYDWAGRCEQLKVLGCELTHDARALLNLKRFTAVNSALEVDLFGQCNLEHANGRAVSGAGGAPDFARAARLSDRGRSIVALNATHSGGKGSRIVASLNENAITSLARVDVDYVITEFGIAKLIGASVHERAEAIISVAAPAFRDELYRSWQAIALRL